MKENIVEWAGFKIGKWQECVDVRDFIQLNYTAYEGRGDFLAPATFATKRLWEECCQLLEEERKKDGVLDVDTSIVSTIVSHRPGYISKDLETIVGLQTDKPLKRSVIVNGGIRMAEQACEAYGYKLNSEISDIYRNHARTHNQAVFEVYTDEMKQVRKLGILTGLPDAYGRGRIIGDYRRVALYGTDYLIEQKQNDLKESAKQDMLADVILSREEIAQQISALKDLTKMAQEYGFDISKPAKNTKEAIQWIYFSYLAAIKEQNGAAMSLGRVATFIDIFAERDLQQGVFNEEQIQEFMDHFVMKLRLAKHLRTPEYNDLFAGDPLWVTEAVGGMGVDGRTLVTKSSFRILHTLYNLGPSPEPNLTVLWSENLPQGFKDFTAQVSIDTSAIQYESDDAMRPIYGDDYAIACCVSAMQIGKQMQFFGARANLGKALLIAINGGHDEITGERVGPQLPKLEGDYLNYDTVRSNYSKVLDWLAGLYVNTMNTIHFMHDKYAYERLQMSLHDSNVGRLMAFGIAGLSVVADSLSAIKYAKVKVIRDEKGVAIGFEQEGEFPCFGNNDERVDALASELCNEFSSNLKKHPTYRGAEHTLSILTITSNVMYGKKTGATPDGRAKGEAYAPGANPMHGRDKKGALAAVASVSKLSYDDCRDGISYTFSAIPASLGKEKDARIANLVAVLDAYAQKGGHHINVNVLDRSVLEDAMEHPENYPQLTIRVSGYAVNFIKLSKQHQKEVIARTFYSAL